jgi:hypothetical protein
MGRAQVEQTNTTAAIGTFNVLNAEDRLVAAALLHPSCDWDDGEVVDVALLG